MSLQAIRFDSSLPLDAEMISAGDNSSNTTITNTNNNALQTEKLSSTGSHNNSRTTLLKDLNNQRLFDQESSVASSSIIRTSPRYNGFKYKGKAPITDVPELVDLCNHFLMTKNINGLAMIARQRGLPPYLRATIWPILLKYHPYVLNPYITPDEETFDDLDNNEEEIIDKIRFDFRKYLRKGYNSFKHSKTSKNNDNNENDDEVNNSKDPELTNLFEIQKQLFDTIERAILKFLKKWGTLINYNTGLTWVAIGLAEWLPPLQNSNYVLCGYDDIAKNGTKLRNLHDNSFERYHPNSYSYDGSSSVVDSSTVGSVDGGNPFTSSSSFSSSSSSSSSTTPNFPSSYNGDSQSAVFDQQIPFKQMTFAEVYERLLLVILHTPEPTSDSNVSNGGNGGNIPTLEDARSTAVIDIPPSSSSSHTNTVSHSPLESSTASVKSSSSASSAAASDSAAAAATTSIDQTDTSSFNSDDMPIFGGSIDDRFSFFLYCLRKCLPELSQYLSDENCLNAKSNKGEWINWWFKWCGAKSWSRYDRGRVWDMLLGWRPANTIKDNDLERLDSEIDEENLRSLGTDLFWCSTFNEPTSSSSSVSSSSVSPNAQQHQQQQRKSNRRNSSIKTLIDSVSIRKLSIHSKNESSVFAEDSNDDDADADDNGGNSGDVQSAIANDNENDDHLKDLPFSRLNPHFEFIFVAIAFLKSKEFALLELEQSEIKEFLNRINSQRIEGFQAGLENEVKETINKSKLQQHSKQKTPKLNPSPEKQPFAPSLGDNSIFYNLGHNNNGSMNNVSESLTPVKPHRTSNDREELGPDEKLLYLSVSEGSGSPTTTIAHHNSSHKDSANTSVSVSFLKNNDHVPRKTSRDIENIIVEAGELWRKFLFKELEEEKS